MIDDTVEVTSGLRSAGADEGDPFAGPDLLVRHTVPEPAGGPPPRRVPMPPVWHMRPLWPAVAEAGQRPDVEPVPARPRWTGRAWLALAAAAILVLTGSAAYALSPPPTTWHAAPAARASAVRPPAPSGATPSIGVADPGGSGGATVPATRPPGVPRVVIGSYEAESGANTLVGGATVTNYRGASGGRVVKNLGAWKSPAGPGGLTFTDVMAPASGMYTLVFSYVHLNGDTTRTAVITVSGARPIEVTVSGGTVCCTRQAVAVRLAAGRNAISFGNRQGTAPAIDKIEIIKGVVG